MIDAGLYISYGLILIALGSSIIFPLIYMAKHPAEAKMTLVSLLVMVVIFILAYIIAADDFYFSGIEKYDLTPQGIKLIGAGLNMTFLLLVLGIVAAVYSEVSSIFK